MKLSLKLTFLLLAQVPMHLEAAASASVQVKNLAEQPISVENFVNIWNLVKGNPSLSAIAKNAVQTTYNISLDSVVRMTKPQITALQGINTAINGGGGAAATWQSGMAAPANAAAPTTGGFTTDADATAFTDYLIALGNGELYKTIFPQGPFYLQRAHEQLLAAANTAGTRAGTAAASAAAAATGEATLKRITNELLQIFPSAVRRNNEEAWLGTNPNYAALELKLISPTTGLLPAIVTNVQQETAYLNSQRYRFDVASRTFAHDPLPAYAAGIRTANVENIGMSLRDFTDQVFANNIRQMLYTEARPAHHMPEISPETITRLQVVQGVPNINRIYPAGNANYDDTFTTAQLYIYFMQSELIIINDNVLEKYTQNHITPNAAYNLRTKIGSLINFLETQLRTAQHDLGTVRTQLATCQARAAAVPAGGGLAPAQIADLIDNHNTLFAGIERDVNAKFSGLLELYTDNAGSHGTVDAKIRGAVGGTFSAGNPIPQAVLTNPLFVNAFGPRGLQKLGFADYVGDEDGFVASVRRHAAQALAELITQVIAPVMNTTTVFRRLAPAAPISTFVLTNDAGPLDPNGRDATNMGANPHLLLNPAPAPAAVIQEVVAHNEAVEALMGPNLLTGIPHSTGPGIEPLLTFYNNRLSQNANYLDNLLGNPGIYPHNYQGSRLNLTQYNGRTLPTDTTGQMAPEFVAAFGVQGLAERFGSHAGITNGNSVATLTAQLKAMAAMCFATNVFPTMHTLMDQAARLRATYPGLQIKTFNVTSQMTIGRVPQPRAPLNIQTIRRDPPHTTATSLIGDNLEITVVDLP